MSSQPPTNAPSSLPSAAAKPSAPRGRSLFRSFKWSLIAMLWLGTSILFAYILTARTPKIVAEWKEPDNVNYQNDDPYVIYVMDRSSVWDQSKRFRYCTIGIVPQKNKNLSGAWTEYEFHNYNNDPNYFSHCTVSWESEGITITEPTGHKLFIPKKAFIEGR